MNRIVRVWPVWRNTELEGSLRSRHGTGGGGGKGGTMMSRIENYLVKELSKGPAQRFGGKEEMVICGSKMESVHWSP